MPAEPKSEPRIPTAQIDPVAEGQTAEGITKLCDDHIARARELLGTIKTLKAQPDAALSWDSVMGRVDEISLELGFAGGFPALMAVGHPDAKVREAAKTCEPKVNAFTTDMYLDVDFAAVVKRYGDRGEKLTGTKARLLRETQRDLRRNGLELTEDKQKQLRAINDELAKLVQSFEANISESTGTLKVKPEQLKGLPQSYLDQHKPGADGMVTLTTNYPDYFPVITYAEDRTVARDLTEKFDNRAADKNLQVLDRVLELRNIKSKLLGYGTWADYAIEPRMAKTAAAVRRFLETLAKDVKAPAQKELAEFKAEYVQRLGKKAADKIPNYDRLYLEQKLREKKYGFDAKALSEYFEVSAVTKGLLDITSKLYGVEFHDVTDAPKWHPDVRVLDVDDHGRKLGRIYLDLAPRDGKYKHAAMFEIRRGMRLPDGSYLKPAAALMCNFPKPGDSPALMAHSDVSTFFHEFGHVLHHVLTQQPLASYAGTSTARDFVEAPSQMFEEWSYRRETLDLFAKHYKTGEKIPDKLFKALQKSRSFGRALGTERQISLATLDFEYHSKPWPFSTDEVFNQVMAKTQSFTYLPGTHFQATFGHLMEYDAGYYGYQWALAIARDVLTRFEKEGFMNDKVASAWRKSVLEQGAGEDESKLVEAFLGRPTDLKAYVAYLKGQ
ncbi:MAG: Zn-dependent oligopeptidase [Deltaproteobacteria bacterium]|nr:Zn-dependent oligopeptidase [Deltaproteobacteria bacterium]